MGKRRLELSGRKFARLFVLNFEQIDNKNYSIWKCRCDCGSEISAQGSRLSRGVTKSCGCLPRDNFKTMRKMLRQPRPLSSYRLNGNSKHPLYPTWNNMLQRCENPKQQRYADYGGRGIRVCERWLSFDNFLTDMSPRPVGKTLDRKNVNEGYNPENCKWATQSEQRKNKRKQAAIQNFSNDEFLAEAHRRGLSL